LRRVSVLWKASLLAFISSFCLMVIELVAGRILAPYIGVSIYTWTSIIGVIMAGIALGNYIGGKIADRFPSPNLLVAAFFLGSLATIAILPAILLVTVRDWFGNLPVVLNFTLKTACIFFLPAAILSVISPVVIKLTLADLGKAGGITGTIYAWSTAGSILGTFMTGFYFILWFGTRMTIWLLTVILLITGIATLFFWQSGRTWKFSRENLIKIAVVVSMLVVSGVIFSLRENWWVAYTRESNYYSIMVLDRDDSIKILSLDHLIHSFVKPDDPAYLDYPYLKVFAEIVKYETRENPRPSMLHLGGGGYSFPRYMEAIYPGSVNYVIEIDPAVTEVAYEELGLSKETSIRTYNQDARLFLTEQRTDTKYDFVIGDVFNDMSTPYQLTTLEFDRLVKANLNESGIYLINIIDKYEEGKYMPSFVYTLQKVFRHVYLFSPGIPFETIYSATFIIAAADHPIDLADFRKFIISNESFNALNIPLSEEKLEKYLAERKPILLTDDYAPTDILVAELTR